ncbi:MAG: hypothetical protein IPJ40_16905 [Saprospirales bacterium]|nr:hypothetical protein [Saprospirales bacterium]
MAKRVIKAADSPGDRQDPQVWDPVQEWLTLNEDILTRFAKLQVEFKIKNWRSKSETGSL